MKEIGSPIDLEEPNQTQWVMEVNPLRAREGKKREIRNSLQNGVPQGFAG